MSEQSTTPISDKTYTEAYQMALRTRGIDHAIQQCRKFEVQIAALQQELLQAKKGTTYASPKTI